MSSKALVPLGGCPVCGGRVAGLFTDRRHMLCRVRLGLHQHPSKPGWCVGSNALAQPMVGAQQLELWPGAA